MFLHGNVWPPGRRGWVWMVSAWPEGGWAREREREGDKGVRAATTSRQRAVLSPLGIRLPLRVRRLAESVPGGLRHRPENRRTAETANVFSPSKLLLITFPPCPHRPTPRHVHRRTLFPPPNRDRCPLAGHPANPDASAIQTLQKHYLRILRLWPRDPLRNVTFQAALSKRLEAPFPTLSSSSSPQGTVPENAAQAVPASGAVKALDEGRALGEANALYSLLENRYSKQVRMASA